MGDARKAVEPLTFPLCLRFLGCVAWLRLPHSSCVTHSASLPRLKPFLPPLPFCHGLPVSFSTSCFFLGGLWKIYNRWAVFEGYVIFNYLFAEAFGGGGICWADCSPSPLAACVHALSRLWVVLNSDNQWMVRCTIHAVRNPESLICTSTKEFYTLFE